MGWSLTELVEAAARCGRVDLAAAAMPRLEERTRAAGTDWWLGVLARAQALMSARRELSATGETVSRRTAETRDALTPQEEQIARMAADGHSNPEIGAELFISPRTVEYHLHKVFRKLDVSSRKELRDVLADRSEQAVVGFV